MRALYARGRTLFDHQHQACECLGFNWMTEHQRRALVRVLRDEVAHCSDRERLPVLARQWRYDHRLLIVHDRVDQRIGEVQLPEVILAVGAEVASAGSCSAANRGRARNC